MRKKAQTSPFIPPLACHSRRRMVLRANVGADETRARVLATLNAVTHSSEDAGTFTVTS